MLDPEDDGITILRNVGHKYSVTPPCEPQLSHFKCRRTNFNVSAEDQNLDLRPSGMLLVVDW